MAHAEDRREMSSAVVGQSNLDMALLKSRLFPNMCAHDISFL